MSYPSQRYDGAAGEVDATFRSAATEPDHVTAGTAFHYLATTASTDGDFGLYRVDMAPRSRGAGLHFHRTMSESFFVLSGALRLHDGDSWRDGGAGDFLYVPAGGLHAFRNDTDAPVSMLMLFAPGAPREGYFEGLSELAGLTDAERKRFFVEHDSYFL